VWLFMQGFLLKTQPKHTFQRLSPWWTHVSLSFLERICRFCGKADAKILGILETDYRLANLFDDHTGKSRKKRVSLRVEYREGIYTYLRK